MFKFFKEIASSIKEGIEEAKQELEEEKKQENESSNIDISQIENIPYVESFGTALGAPFRVVISGDWFTMFKKLEESTDDYYPVHLYSFGEYPKLNDFQKAFVMKLKIDFGIVNDNSCWETLSSFFDFLSLSKENTALANIEGPEVDIPYAKLPQDKQSAVLACIISHIISASTDVGYIKKEDALVILEKVIIYIKQHHNNWKEYAVCFIEGQAEVGLNKFIGKSTLQKYIGYLESKKGSPWNNIGWTSSKK